jgi:hypothetical protein
MECFSLCPVQPTNMLRTPLPVPQEVSVKDWLAVSFVQLMRDEASE